MFSTVTLSNGNLTLLNDMCKHGNMKFTHIFSSEMFKSYKPSPKVYLGAAEKLGLKPEECVMVSIGSLAPCLGDIGLTGTGCGASR